MRKIVVPLAGKDRAFLDRGLCKPFVKYSNSTIIQSCINSLREFYYASDTIAIFVLLRELEERFNMVKMLKSLFPFLDSKFIIIDKETRGAAESVLSAMDIVNNDDELIIHLADILFSGSEDIYLNIYSGTKIDGMIPYFKSSNPKYSYLQIYHDGTVIRVKEKEVISENASLGFYYFRRADFFRDAAEQMIKDNLKVNNQFYVCPVYNYLIKASKTIKSIQCSLLVDFGSHGFLESV